MSHLQNSTVFIFSNNLIACITSLKTMPHDANLLICIAEKNILIWNAKARHPISEFAVHKANVIYSFVTPEQDLMESVDANFQYIKWDWDRCTIISATGLYTQSASFLEEELGTHCTIFQNYAFIGTTAGNIRVFSLDSFYEIDMLTTNNSNK